MRSIPAVLVLLLASLLTSCEVVKGIFDAGMFIGVLVVVVIVAIVGFVVVKLKR
jgi:hypothetical protein